MSKSSLKPAQSPPEKFTPAKKVAAAYAAQVGLTPQSVYQQQNDALKDEAMRERDVAESA